MDIETLGIDVIVSVVALIVGIVMLIPVISIGALFIMGLDSAWYWIVLSWKVSKWILIGTGAVCLVLPFMNLKELAGLFVLGIVAIFLGFFGYTMLIENATLLYTTTIKGLALQKTMLKFVLSYVILSVIGTRTIASSNE